MLTSCVSIKPVNKNLVTFLTDHCPFLLNIEFLLMSLELRPFPDYRRQYNTAFLLFLFVKFITKINITPKKTCPGMLNTIVISEEHFLYSQENELANRWVEFVPSFPGLDCIKSISVLKYLYRLPLWPDRSIRCPHITLVLHNKTFWTSNIISYFSYFINIILLNV